MKTVKTLRTQPKIQSSKVRFNHFFHHDLYGRFDSDQNIILSRGGWEDENVRYPNIFHFCLNYALKKHWAGYSDSLGHKSTIKSLLKLVNVNKYSRQYQSYNLAITMGNVVTLGLVFKKLKVDIPDATVITFKPYYPPIIKSVSDNFKKIQFISSLKLESEILSDLKKKLVKNTNTIIFLTNTIGVEGRTYSLDFWGKVMILKKRYNAHLVIDEGDWFEVLPYPDNINSPKVIRVVSLSKKYGVPGFKLGYMIGDKNFIREFYEYASTNYGGPPSIFFLLSEFIYHFEYLYFSKRKLAEESTYLIKQYNIPQKKIASLYTNYINAINNNQKKLATNQRSLANWATVKQNYVKNIYNYGGINVIIELHKNITSYNLFLRTIKSGVSIFPGACIGDEGDTLFRITLLEKPEIFKKGLRLLSNVIKKL